MTIHYLEEYCIAGKDYSGDAFFIDTNYLIAFVNTEHPYHLTTLIHTIFLLKQNAKLYISETVLSEAIDVLARGLYTEEKFKEWLNSDDYKNWISESIRTEKDHNEKKDEFRASFIQNVVKNHLNPDLLRHFNLKATDILSSIVDTHLFKLSNTTFTVLTSGMHLAKTVPLQSNDAFIAAAALRNSGNILSYDKDFKNVTIMNPSTGNEANFITGSFPNNYLTKSRALELMNNLDSNLKDIVELIIGGPINFEAIHNTKKL